MILTAIFWLPGKVLRYFLAPVIAMTESLGDLSNEEIDDYLLPN